MSNCCSFNSFWVLKLERNFITHIQDCPLDIVRKKSYTTCRLNIPHQPVTTSYKWNSETYFGLSGATNVCHSVLHPHLHCRLHFNLKTLYTSVQAEFLLFILVREGAQARLIIRWQCKTNAQGVRERNDEESMRGKTTTIKYKRQFCFFFSLNKILMIFHLALITRRARRNCILFRKA